MRKGVKKEFGISEARLIATYEEIYSVPYDACVTYYWGDSGMHHIKNDANPDKVDEAYRKALQAMEMDEKEYTAQRYVYRDDIIARMHEVKLKKEGAGLLPDFFDVIAVFNTPVLYTNQRLDRTWIPEDLFCCDVRGNNKDDFYQIKTHVGVDHVGTILSKEKFNDITDEFDRVSTIEDGIGIRDIECKWFKEKYSVAEYREQYDQLVNQCCEQEQDNEMRMASL